MFRQRGRGAVVCRYLAFHDSVLNKAFRLPMVHIRVKHGGQSFRTNALVDSGATTTFLPIELVNILGVGLKVEGEEQSEEEQKKHPKLDAVGASGIFKTYRVPIDSIQVLKGLSHFYEQKNSIVVVPTKVGSLHYAVLGRDGIFLRRHVTFKEADEHVVFRRNHWGKKIQPM